MRSLLLITFLGLSPTLFAQAPPPTLDEETKGEAAIPETLTPPDIEIPTNEPIATEGEPQENISADSQAAQTEDQTDPATGINRILGDATITESRRENGQRYLIELEHSSGSKQYIEDNDSDGKIQATDNDLESEPNLPKWRLGRW